MASDDWYRNKKWNKKIEDKFFEKLARARNKEQYLRIQACTLASNEPNVALQLLDKYFDLDDDFDHAQAYVDRATAYLALGDIEHTIEAYKAALDREENFSGVQTEAYLQLPFLVATYQLSEMYDQCQELLETHKDRLMFPVDFFLWYASNALILSDTGNVVEAKIDAEKALEAAKQEKSGFKHHPSLGLVGKKYSGLLKQLKKLIKA